MKRDACLPDAIDAWTINHREVEATMQPQAPREVARGRPEGPATSPIHRLRAVITISGGGLQLGFVCPP